MHQESRAARRLRDLAFAPTPVTGTHWKQMPERQRIDTIAASIAASRAMAGTFSVVSAAPDGQVVVRFLRPVATGARGGMLLDLEELLKAEVEPAITVWLEPLGDRNSLRKLRGLEIKP